MKKHDRTTARWFSKIALCGLLATAATAQAGQVRFAGEGHAYHPMWSHDGKWIAFEVNRYAGNVDLFVAQVNGDIAKDGVKVALPGGSNPFGGSGQVVVNPVWHPDGPAVFEGSNQGGQFRLYYHAPGTGAAAELISTTELGGDLTFPAVSADGKTMAFIADATGSGDVRTRDTQTSQIAQLTSTSSAEMFPQFSSDGSKLLFTRKHNQSEDVFELVVSSGAESEVASGSGDQTRPTYAADGAVLYFDNSRGDGQWDLVAITGGSKKTLARDVRLPHRARPAVTPDGKWVAFAYDDPTKADKVVLMRVDGSKTVDVTTDFKACGEPALAVQGGRTLLAFTALPNSGADWRFLYVQDVTDKL